eukprot:5552348-Prymnesium_polylepis.2
MAAARAAATHVHAHVHVTCETRSTTDATRQTRGCCGSAVVVRCGWCGRARVGGRTFVLAQSRCGRPP